MQLILLLSFTCISFVFSMWTFHVYFTIMITSDHFDLFFTNFLTNYLIMILVILVLEKNLIHNNDNHELKRKKAEELQSRMIPSPTHRIPAPLTPSNFIQQSNCTVQAVQESRPTKRQKRSANSSRSHSHSIHSASLPSLLLPSTPIPALLPPSSSSFSSSATPLSSSAVCSAVVVHSNNFVQAEFVLSIVSKTLP